jgi:hypothetical protein
MFPEESTPMTTLENIDRLLNLKHITEDYASCAVLKIKVFFFPAPLRFFKVYVVM